jgi:hypothetical protein
MNLSLGISHEFYDLQHSICYLSCEFTIRSELQNDRSYQALLRGGEL